MHPLLTRVKGDVVWMYDLDYSWKSDVLLWIPTHGRTRVGRSAKTYIRSMRTLDAAKKTYQERYMIMMLTWICENSSIKGIAK